MGPREQPIPFVVVADASYPLVLEPHLAERVWGGSAFGPGIGEAWDLSVHPNGPSRITNGPLAGSTLAEAVEADPDAFGGPIDLLAKRLDCAEDLSVQVHPDTGDPKTEAWIVLGADDGAGVYLGFRDRPSAEQVRAAALDGSIVDLLDFRTLRDGEAVFVPARTVHAIGGGLRLFELQQNSDTTYRLYDWGRGRDLHLEDGLAVTDLGPARPTPEAVVTPDGARRLVSCPFFHVDHVTGGVDLDPGDRWVAVLVVAGAATVGGVEAGAGATVLVPAAAGTTTLEPAAGFEGLRYGPGA